MPRQSGSSVVTLLSGSVKVEPTSASSTDGAGLPVVPLSVQPCTWAGENSSVVLSACVIVPTRSLAVIGDGRDLGRLAGR